MSVLIDGTNLVAIQMFFVEVENRNGGESFYFIRNQSDFEDWKAKGYKTQEEFDKIKSSASNSPGMPAVKEGDSKKIISELTTWWSRMSWREQNMTYSRCLKQVTGSDGEQKTVLDSILFRDAKLKICLKKWNLKNDSNEEVPITEQVIDSLVPEVASELLFNFEKVTEASEDDLKN